MRLSSLLGVDGVINTPTGERALAVTKSYIWKHGTSSKIYFGKAAFSSREQLTVAMAHELGHMVYANNIALNKWADQATGHLNSSLNTEGHIAIQKMTGNLIIDNGWNPSLFSTQVWDFRDAQMYQQLYDPIKFLVKPIVFP